MRKVLLPHTPEELWEALRAEPQAAVYAGGTDLLVKLRQGLVDPSCLVCLERIEELKGVQEFGHEVFIGACSTHTYLLANPIIRSNFPVLTRALELLGSPPIRNMGTIGGNICTASPAADSLPPLYVLEAEVEIRSKNTSRRMALKEFIQGPGKTSLQPGEIVSGIWVKKAPGYNLHHFEKVGQRKALAISIASLAGLLRASEKGVIEEARFAWGSVGPTIITSPEVEKALVGNRLSRPILEKAACLARSAVDPIDDIRASGEYRRLVSGNLMVRLLTLQREVCH
jgi:xanthine dehydrogenase FAD-binding subunit